MLSIVRVSFGEALSTSNGRQGYVQSVDREGDMACNSRWSSCRIDVQHGRNCQPVFGLLVLGAGWRRSLPNCPRAPMLPKIVVYLTIATARETSGTSTSTICNPVLRLLYLSPVVLRGMFTSHVWCPLLSLAFQEYLMHQVCYKMSKFSRGALGELSCGRDFRASDWLQNWARQ